MEFIALFVTLFRDQNILSSAPKISITCKIEFNWLFITYCVCSIYLGIPCVAKGGRYPTPHAVQWKCRDSHPTDLPIVLTVNTTSILLALKWNYLLILFLSCTEDSVRTRLTFSFSQFPVLISSTYNTKTYHKKIHNLHASHGGIMGMFINVLYSVRMRLSNIVSRDLLYAYLFLISSCNLYLFYT